MKGGTRERCRHRHAAQALTLRRPMRRVPAPLGAGSRGARPIRARNLHECLPMKDPNPEFEGWPAEAASR
jgi:hypothetical protein